MRSRFMSRNVKVRRRLTTMRSVLIFDAELIKLKRDWESDKAKVEKMRQERKFRPY